MKNLSKYRIHSLAISLAVIGSFGLAIAETGSSVANPGNGPHKHHRMGHRCEAMKKLNLSDEQKAKLKTLHESSREENKATFESMKAKFQQLRALEKTPANDAQRQQLKAELKQEREALHSKRKAMMQQVLSNEQMKQWEGLKAQCRTDWKQKHQQKKNTGKQAG